MSAINWDDSSEVGARIVEQFAKCLATEFADAEHDGTYDDLVSGYRDGSITFGVNRYGMSVLENTTTPPPSGN
jgi:hypothetical protein